jgi:hypothetical protein
MLLWAMLQVFWVADSSPFLGFLRRRKSVAVPRSPAPGREPEAGGKPSASTRSITTAATSGLDSFGSLTGHERRTLPETVIDAADGE